MTPKSRSTSSLSRTADGSSMMINFASCERARAMLTICWDAAESEPTSAPGRISGCPRRVSSCGGGAVGDGRAGDAEPGVLAAQEDVVGHGEAGDQVELLVDRRDARARIAACGSPSVDRLAPPDDVPLVGLVRPGEHLDQRRLAGAVLAEQAVHLTGADVEVDAVEGPDARELLDDAVHLQQRGSGRDASDASTTMLHLRTSAQR